MVGRCQTAPPNLEYMLQITPPILSVYERKPETLIAGLSKIGGLIALLKLASFL